MRTSIILLCLILFLPAPAKSQVPGPAASRPLPTVPAAALQADLRILRQALETLHPGLLRYNTPNQMNARFDSLAVELDHEQSLAEAYLAIARFANTIECGHTFPNPYNQEGLVRQVIVEGGGRVPFYFRWLDGQMIVTRNLSHDAALVPGTEVLAINGVASAEILQRLLPLSRADGGNDAKRIANLEVIEGERYNAFDTYFPLVFPPPAGPWRFSLRAPDGTTRMVSLETVSDSGRSAIADSVGNAGRDSLTPPWTLRYPDSSVAVLSMPTWVTYRNQWDWEGFIHRAFAGLVARGTPNLVIDLRGNEGGTSVGDVILQHLIDAPLALSASERFTRYQRIPPGLKPYLDTWDRSFDDWGGAATPSASQPGFYRMTKYDDGPAGTVIQPAAPRYRGKVWVLVGPENSSATFEFALGVKENHLATLVGRPTGGNRRGINGGAFYFLRLPNSGIEVDLPLIAQFPVSPQPDAGIEPDIVVLPTPRDVATGTDAELEAVLMRSRAD